MNFMINDRVIFTASSGVLETIYSEIEEVTKIKKITLSSEVQQLINKLKIFNGHFPYFDIAEFVKTSIGMTNFLNIFEKSLNEAQAKFTSKVVDDLWNYYEQLIKYRDELKAQDK